MRHRPGWRALLLRVLLANTAMMIVLGQLHRGTAWWLDAGTPDRVLWLSVSVAAGAGAYFVALLVLGMRPAQFQMRHD
jgi:putative peptidoglycan lipid II flippase